MVLKRKASAKWEGTLKGGNGKMKYGSYTGNYSFSSRFEEGEGTNPEELIGAAEAGCFSMALSAGIESAGFNPQFISTEAVVNFEKKEEGWRITSIELNTEAQVPDISEVKFQELANKAKAGCPISNALGGVEINLTAKLIL